MFEYITLQNPHWEGKKYNYLLTRKIFARLVSNLENNNLILSLEGPRRVGKSILIKQLMDSLLNSKVSSKDIFYFSFDDFYLEPIKVIKEYEQLRGKSLRDGKMYFFFDEVQKIKDWQTQIKIIYDNYSNIKIIISGSTLRQNKKESLAGRILEYFINYLSFEEFELFSNNTKILSSEIDDVFISEYNLYLSRQYPELTINRILVPKEYIYTIVKKVIFEDSEKFIENVDKDLLHKIFNIVLRNPGQIIDYSDLAKDLGSNRKIISNYIDFLINSSIVRKVYNFSNNARKIESSSRKFYPFCTSLISYMSENSEMSKIIETDVAFQLNAEYFWNKDNEEIDFIIDSKKRMGLEVKYKLSIDTKDIKTFNSKEFEKLHIVDKIIIIRDNSKLFFDTKEIIPIKYYTLWKTKERLLNL